MSEVLGAMAKTGEVHTKFRPDLELFVCQWIVRGTSFTAMGETVMEAVSATFNFACRESQSVRKLFSPT